MVCITTNHRTMNGFFVHQFHKLTIPEIRFNFSLFDLYIYTLFGNYLWIVIEIAIPFFYVFPLMPNILFRDAVLTMHNKMTTLSTEKQYFLLYLSKFSVWCLSSYLWCPVTLLYYFSFRYVCGDRQELYYVYFHLQLPVWQECCHFVQKFISRWSFCMIGLVSSFFWGHKQHFY